MNLSGRAIVGDAARLMHERMPLTEDDTINESNCKRKGEELNRLKKSSSASAGKEGTAKKEKVSYGQHYTKGKNGRKELKPNVEYTDSNGYTYTTDEYGRIESVSGSLKKQKGIRNQNSQKVAGREERKCEKNNNLAEGEVPDDGGHLIATIFNGSGDLDNLVAMNRTLNRGDWKSMELSWKNAL